MRAGDLVFFRNPSLISRIIRFFTKGQYSHVGLAISDMHIVEADRFIKTRIVPLNKKADGYTIYRPKQITNVQRERIVEFALTTKGTDYDYLKILGLFIQLIFNLDSHKGFNDANRYICSELIDLAYYTAGVPRKLDRNIGDVTPQDLLEIYELEEITLCLKMT